MLRHDLGPQQTARSVYHDNSHQCRNRDHLTGFPARQLVWAWSRDLRVTYPRICLVLVSYVVLTHFMKT